MWYYQAKKDASEAVLNHFEGILAFFNNRSTNAHAESLNAQIKLFRANLRGVSNPNCSSIDFKKSLLKLVYSPEK